MITDKNTTKVFFYMLQISDCICFSKKDYFQDMF